MSQVLVLLVAIVFVLLSVTVVADNKTPANQPQAVPVEIQGGFGAPGGWAEEAQRDAERERQNTLTNQSKKGPGQ